MHRVYRWKDSILPVFKIAETKQAKHEKKEDIQKTKHYAFKNNEILRALSTSLRLQVER